MDVNELIDNLRMPSWHDLEDPDATLLADASDALSTLQAENEKLRAELEQVKQERDVAIKEIFQWTGCPACKHWDSADNWCNKHDRSADSCDGCSTPEWHGLEKA